MRAAVMDHPTHDQPDDAAEERRVNALFAAFDDLGIVMYSTRHSRFVTSGASEWIMSKASGVAPVLIDADEHALRLECQVRENRRSVHMTYQETRFIAIAMCDAVYMFANAILRRRGSSLSQRDDYSDLRREFEPPQPSYPLLRDYLAFDCDARYLLACTIAFDLTTGYSKPGRHHEKPQRQRGWI